MLFRHKGVSQIIAARKKEMKWRQGHPNSSKTVFISEEANLDARMDLLMKKEHLGIEDKMDVLSQIEKKYRIGLSVRFPVEKIKLKVIHEKTILQTCYDCSKKSYYIIKGTMYSSRQRSGLQLKQQIFLGERCIGLFFSDSTFRKATLSVQQSLFLEIPHSTEDLEEVEYNILMTSRQKERAIRSFKLFDCVDNLHRYYLPYFEARRYTKGQYIYKRGDQPDGLSLIIEGEVSFQTAIPVHQNHQSRGSMNLVELIRQKKTDEHWIVTQVLTGGSYFGQEEVLENRSRLQNAKCSSITSLLLMIPTDKAQTLISLPQFLQNIESSSHNRKLQRFKILCASSKLKQVSVPHEIDTELLQKFEHFKFKMFNYLSDEKEDSPQRKLSLGRSKRKIMHGYSVKMNRRSCQTEPVPFSMLAVNEETYQKTIKRFRHSLKQIQKEKQPKVRVELNQGRSLVQCWNILQLETVFDPEKLSPNVKIQHKDCDGRQSYQTYSRLIKNVKNTHSTRPKGFTTSCRLKQEYIRYLQNLS